MPRSSAKYIGSARPVEAQHDVLGSAGDRRDIVQRALAQPLLRHPVRNGFQVHYVLGVHSCQPLACGVYRITTESSVIALLNLSIVWEKA